MATAPAEAGTMIPGEDIPENIDYEAEARKMGWTFTSANTVTNEEGGGGSSTCSTNHPAR